MPVNFLPAERWFGRNDPEDGAAALRMHHLERKDARRGLIGFASDAGVKRNKGRPGARDGPAAIRDALTNMAVPANQPRFTDLGDIEVTGDDLEDGQAALAKQIAEAPANIERLIVLGGGHETAFGSYSGLAKKYPSKRIGIINLDAHLDLRLAGKNGASSGTPFAQIRALASGSFDYLCLGVAEESNTQALMARAEEWNVGIVTDHALIADRNAAGQQIAALIDRNDLVYLTIDIDVLPHFQAPGVSAPAARGVPLSTIEHLVERIISLCDERRTALPLADIVELSPPHDPQGVTAKSAALLVRRLLCS